MPRHKNFDRHHALELAMGAFWRRGYEATSLVDLTEAMGIGRQSLYNTFGDKHALLLECLDSYAAAANRDVFAPMHRADGGLEAIRAFLHRSITNMVRPPRMACFMVNSTLEIAPHDDDVAERASRFSTDMSDALLAALEVADARGEVTVTDLPTTAWLLRNTWYGLAASSKTGLPEATLRAVADEIVHRLTR